ncbi:MAG: TVP38/TMEM64 family protein [Rhodospirillales bacterium]|nr:TVP38/TMEM64 family protein [Rhodospirillales bacterium]
MKNDVKSEGSPRKQQGWRRCLPLLSLVGASLLGFALLIDRGGLSFQDLSAHSRWLHDHVASGPLLTGLVLFLLYSAATALSLPIATMLTVLAGYLFGTLIASIWVILGATVGSLIVFLVARYALYETFKERAGPWLGRMEKGFQEDALSYILVLRLLPIFPFWLVNLAPALLGVKLWVYTLGTALGIVPGVLVYASLGTGLGKVIARGEEPDLSIVLDPVILLPLMGLAVLAILPVAWKRWRKADG